MNLHDEMDIEKGGKVIELKENLMVTKGEASLPPPPSSPYIRDRSTNPEDDDKYLIPIPPWTCKEIIVASLATCAVSLSVIIILLPFVNPFVFVTGIFGLIVPPYSALQEQKITDCRAMKETNMAMEREMNNLKYENERLSYQNDQLETSVSKIQSTKETLDEVRRTNVTSVAALEKQLKESQLVLAQMEENRRSTLVDNLFTVILALDKDGDFILSDDEIDTVTKKIEQIQGVDIDDALFKEKVIEYGRDLDAVMKLMNGLLDDDPNTAPIERKIFKIAPISES